MSNNRTILVHSTKTRAEQEITTDVSTWGELKKLINPDFNVGNAKCMVRENRTTLENAQAELPDGDFTLFVYPDKVKSGGARKKSDAYADLSDAKLRSSAKMKGLATNGVGHVLRSRLRAYDRRNDISGADAPKTASASSKKTNKARTKPATKKVISTPEKKEGPTQEAGESVEERSADAADIKADHNPDEVKSKMKTANQDVNIVAFVIDLKHTFNGLFDGIIEKLETGKYTAEDGSIKEVKTNTNVLQEEAEALAREMGIKLS